MMGAVLSRGRAGGPRRGGGEDAAPGMLSGIGGPKVRPAGPHFCNGSAGPAMEGGQCACARHAIFAVAALEAESGG